MKKLFLSITAMMVFFVPLFAAGADVDDLKAASLQASALRYSLDQKDIDAYAEVFHKDFFYIGTDLDFIHPTKEQYRQGKADFIASTGSTSYHLIDVEYKVVGNTGVVCHYGTQVTRPKDGPVVIENLTFTVTYVKTGGKWLLLTYHASPITAGS